jgi:hypothetical protein
MRSTGAAPWRGRVATGEPHGPSGATHHQRLATTRAAHEPVAATEDELFRPVSFLGDAG